MLVVVSDYYSMKSRMLANPIRDQDPEGNVCGVPEELVSDNGPQQRPTIQLLNRVCRNFPRKWVFEHTISHHPHTTPGHSNNKLAENPSEFPLQSPE